MLWLTGLFFLTNAVHAAARGYAVYATAFAALAATSYLLHSTPPTAKQHQLLHSLDQLAVWCVVLIGAFYWQQLSRDAMWVPLVCIVVVGIIWYGGRITESFTYSSDDTQRLPAHGVMHLLASIGHHAVLTGI